MAADVTAMIGAIRRKGLKVTPQRHLLCSVIAVSDDHPTVETVHQRAVQQMPTLSLKTVYTTLAELAELGLIRLSTLGTGTLRVDADVVPHAHLVCRSCGAVVDQPLEPADRAALAHAASLGFQVEEQEVIYRGRCARCRTASAQH